MMNLRSNFNTFPIPDSLKQTENQVRLSRESIFPLLTSKSAEIKRPTTSNRSSPATNSVQVTTTDKVEFAKVTAVLV
jgi:hypothetical protein